jgi:hypothetical protein
LKFPGKLTVSAGIGESRKWLIGGKVAPKIFRTSEYYNNFDNVGYGKYGNVSLGGITFLITTHFKLCERIVYRGGLKYEKTGLVVDGNR